MNLSTVLQFKIRAVSSSDTALILYYKLVNSSILRINKQLIRYRYIFHACDIQAVRNIILAFLCHICIFSFGKLLFCHNCIVLIYTVKQLSSILNNLIIVNRFCKFCCLAVNCSCYSVCKFKYIILRIIVLDS